MSSVSTSTSTATKVLARVRRATVSDVPQIYRILQQMAEFEHLTHRFSATESLLSSTIFPTAPSQSPPLCSVTVLIADINRNLVGNISNDPDPDPHFTPILREVDLAEGDGGEEGEERAFFENEKNGWEVAGLTLFFPNYSTFLTKPGFYVEDLFVRKEFRRQGLGTMLFSAVAKKAVEMEMGAMQWSVSHWNVNAIKFYQEKMGATMQPGWRTCCLDSDALQALAHKED